MSTGETEAQVDPAISNFQTVLTSIGARRDLAYLVEVATLLCHMFLFSFLDAPGCSCLFSQGSQELLLMNPFEQEKTYRSPYVLCTCSTFVVYRIVCRQEHWIVHTKLFRRPHCCSPESMAAEATTASTSLPKRLHPR
jgi:hypothetical protein